MSRRIDPAVLYSLLSLALFPVLAHAGKKPDPCPAGRYVVVTPEGAPFVAVEYGETVALDAVCDPIAPVKLSTTRKGATKVKTKWDTCIGFSGKVRLGAKITDDCTMLSGTLHSKHTKTLRFTAVLEPSSTTTTSLPGTTTTTSLPGTTTTTVPSTTSTTVGGSSTTSTSTSTTSSSSTSSSTSTSATTATSGTVTTVSITLPPSSTTSTSTTTSTSSTLPPPVLSLAMTANPDPVALGGLITYDLTVTNPGAVDADGVTLRMPVPTGLYSTSGCRAVSDGGTFPGACAAGQNIVWSLGTIAPGTSRTVQFVGQVTVAGLPDGTIIHGAANVADVTNAAADAAQADAVVDNAAPLTLSLDEDHDPIAVDGRLEYVLRFGNRSAAPLLSTSLALTLPAGVVVVDAGGATVVANTATWTLGTVNDGDAGERRVAVMVTDLGAADPLIRLASATLTSGAESARATTLTHVEASSPLALALTATPDPVSLGGLVTYSLTVTNTGGQDASGVALQLRVPEGLYSTSGCRAVSDAGVLPAACTQGRDVDWDLGTLPAASSRTVQFVGQVTVAGLPDGQLLRANARVRDAAGDAARAQLATTIATNAPLVLTLDEHDDPVVTNGALEYVLRFGNRSASPLLTTSLTLTLPSGVTVLDDGGAVVTGSTAAWNLGTLGAHVAGERRVAVQIDALANDPLVRGARAVLASGAAAARAAVVTHVETAPPLALRVTATPDPVGLGDIITYSVTVTNTGNTDSAGLVVDLRVPEGLYSTSGCQAVSDGGTLPAACASGRDVEWTITSLPAGSSRTLQFVGVVTVAGVADGDLIHATARVRDVAGAAARADVTTIVTDNPALALRLDESADPVRPDGTLAYVLRFGNRSASPLVSTSLSLVLPPGVTVVDDGNATVTGNTAVWDLATLGAGDAGERRLTVQVDTLANDPLVRIAHAELTSGTNAARAAVLTHVESAPPLALVMTATPDPVELGEIITYSLTVTNTGDTDADGVIVDLRVPAGMYSTSGCQAVSDGGTLPAACATGRDIEWSLSTLAAGASRTVQFVGLVTVAGLPDGHLIHADARVRDVSSAAARAEVTTTVGNNPPLALTLDDVPDPIAVGDTINYVLRFGNRSAGALVSSALVLSLPPGVSVVDDGGATIIGDDAVWDLGTLAAGAIGTHHVTVEVTDLGATDPLVRMARAVVQSGAEAARAAAVTHVEAVSPLSLTLTATPDPIALGGLITYTLTVANGGGSDAVGVELRMPVPSGLYSTSGCNSVSDGGVLPAGCAAGRDIVWDLGTIATGANRAVQFVGKVTVAGLPDGTLIHATARVRDVVGSAARAGVTTAVN